MRLTVLAAAPVVACLLGSAGPAPTAAGPDAGHPSHAAERQCFDPAQVRNFRSGRNQTLYLKVRSNSVYELQTTGACTDVDDAYQLAILPGIGSGRLCSGDWATLVVPGSAGPLERCRVQITKVLSAEEVAALPAQYRP